MFKKVRKLEKELKESRTEYKKTRESLAELRDENENCYRKIFRQSSVITKIVAIVEENNYNNPEVKLRKIKELITDHQSKY